ncbi:MAG: hypothetical protein KDA32_04680 [Phycisphaerales bacterium]|nr:hypothetical protein [Phycisphaerales bacterium]
MRVRRTPFRFGVEAVMAASVLAAGGCTKGNLIGNWEMTRCVPNREVFSIERIEFADGGAYEANICLDGRRAEEAGRYDFDGFYLYLMPSGGGRRKFDAFRVGSSLEIGDGKERRAYLRRR